MKPRLPLTTVGALLFVVGLGACRSSRPGGDRLGEKPELTVEDLHDMLAEGTLRPVNTMDPEGESETEPFADPDSVDLNTDDSDYYVDVPQNPYIEFGDRIVVYDDGRIAKMYPLRSGTGIKMQDLIRTYAPFPVWKEPEPPAEGEEAPAEGEEAAAEVEETAADAPDPRDFVRVDLHEGWDIELVTNLRMPVPDAGTPLPLADWLVVTATPEYLREVEDFINTFAASVPQIEIEAKIVEVTTTDSLAIGVGQIDPDTPIADFPDNAFVKSLGFNFGVPGGANAVVGAIQDGTSVNATLEALAMYENVSIISRPKVAVREGGRAQIVNTTEIPFFNITGISGASGQFGASLTFREVGVQLYVVPRVVGTEAVALNIDIEVSQQSGTAVTFVTGDNEEISNPVISKRAASTIVYLEPGQAVILGGLITERIVKTVDKVPILGDIPVLGHLFKRTVTGKEDTNVLFFIRPRILQGSDVNREF